MPFSDFHPRAIVCERMLRTLVLYAQMFYTVLNRCDTGRTGAGENNDGPKHHSAEMMAEWNAQGSKSPKKRGLIYLGASVETIEVVWRSELCPLLSHDRERARRANL
jgi:hypothetical protein